MAFIVEMFRGDPNSSEYRYFSCSGEMWSRSQNLAEKFGWEPKGSIYEKDINSKIPNKGNYEPSSWGDADYKLVTTDDAVALAFALKKALGQMNDAKLKKYGGSFSTVLGDGLSLTELTRINQTLSKEFLEELIQFLNKGEFNFVWDD